MQMVSTGETMDDIASVIGIAENTLRKHFADEISTAKAKMRAHILGLLFKSADNGNVSAQKYLERLTAMTPTRAKIEPKQPPIGKKEAALQAAKAPVTATGWKDLLN